MKSKKVAIFMGHPAHFHMLKNTCKQLNEKGIEFLIIIKKKDILEKLIREAGYNYHIIRGNRSNGIKALVSSVLGMEINMAKLLIKEKVDILVGTTLTFAAKMTRTKVVVLNEDDANVVPLYAKLSYPFASNILSPISCNNGKWEYKSIKYAGFQKLAYLHPNQFKPNVEIVKKYIPIDKPYFLLRFAKLNAHHDVGANGISTKVAQNLIDILSKYGNVYITSERELEPQFEKYRLNINPLDIHHIMASAKLYIGDSQSMAVEAAMLGVPSIRFNSFAGKIGVLEELENKYDLTHSISSNHPDELYDFVNNLLSQENLRDTYQSRRKRMLADKIDVTAFFTWFIENYPESKKIMKEKPDYQYRFK